jgi:hypothetical protein
MGEKSSTRVARMGEKSNARVAQRGEKNHAYTILVRKRQGKGPLGRRRRRWVENIKIDLGEIEWGCIDWIHLAQDRDQWRALVNTVINLRVP